MLFYWLLVIYFSIPTVEVYGGGGIVNQTSPFYDSNCKPNFPSLQTRPPMYF